MKMVTPEELALAQSIRHEVAYKELLGECLARISKRGPIGIFYVSASAPVISAVAKTLTSMAAESGWVGVKFTFCGVGSCTYIRGRQS